MRWIEVKGKAKLKGTLGVPGSKNSSLGLLAAACLGEEKIILRNMMHSIMNAFMIHHPQYLITQSYTNC